MFQSLLSSQISPLTILWFFSTNLRYPTPLLVLNEARVRKHALATGASDWDRHDHLSDIAIDCDQTIIIVRGRQ